MKVFSRFSILFLMFILAASSCAKPEPVVTDSRSAEARRIDSINMVRQQMNERTAAKNATDRFADISGSHQLRFSSDGVTPLVGTLHFTKTGRDQYEIKGGAKAGKNQLSVIGTVQRVSKQHLKFEGEIHQTIHGVSYQRTGNKTFLDEGQGKLWRLQDKINGEGFVEYIDIYR